MAGNSQRKGAVRKGGSKKGQVVGSGGQRRRGLEARGATPKAVDRTYHPAHKKAKAAAKTKTVANRKTSRRGEGGPEYVVGRNPVVECLRADVPATALYVMTTIDADDRVREAVATAGDMGIAILEASKLELDRLTTNVTSSNPDARQNTLDVLLRTNSLNREDALALLSGELLGVGRALGLDSVRVDRGYDVDTIFQDAGQLAAENQDPTTRLTLSKRVSPDVEVIISQDLSKSGLTGVVSYRPWRGLELRGTQRDNSDRNYAIRHQITFGAVPAPASTKRQLPDVGAVEIDGVPADEPALRRLLKMTPGKTFDFIDWREDIDRLRAWYHDRRRLEARVRASRSERPDGTVALAYRIVPGPETLLELERVPESKSLRRALENAWTGAVYDRFLTDDLRWLVQLELIRRNPSTGWRLRRTLTTRNL